jgi:hypothetical protein
LNHQQTSSPQCAGTPSSWTHSLILIPRGRASSNHGTTTPRISRYRWAVSPSDDNIPKISAQMLCFQIAWELSRA